jgi:hypothetical protein
MLGTLHSEILYRDRIFSLAYAFKGFLPVKHRVELSKNGTPLPGWR